MGYDQRNQALEYVQRHDDLFFYRVYRIRFNVDLPGRVLKCLGRR